MSLTYAESVSKLLSLADFERKSRQFEPPSFHLKRTYALLSELGDPHLAVPAIHVAGTKGKGSVCAMTAAALTACGLKTGLFISPHLHRITERICVDMDPISEETFTTLVERIWPIAERIGERGDSGMVSVFEFQTVMAFLHFAEVGADASVIEVGLGGRLDSTNVLRPEVSVITPIGLDHVAILGDTIAAIAGEKAGIIKPGIPVVTAKQRPEAMEVIQRVAAGNLAPLIQSTDIQLIESEPCGHGPQKLRLRGKLGEYDVRMPLLGEHQVGNTRVAISALEAFASRARPLRPERIAAGLSAVEWPARVQLLEAGPPALIADGAHNADSAEALRAAIGRHFGTPSDLVLILGATAGHDHLAVANSFADLGPKVIVTSSRHPKSVPPEDFARALTAARINISGVTSDTQAALDTARGVVGPGGMIIAAGSLFVAAEVIEAVRGIEPEIYPDLRGSSGPGRAPSPQAAPAP
jgi:dihydrofolate synthase/folylpolyglutamate synthase